MTEIIDENNMDDFGDDDGLIPDEEPRRSKGKELDKPVANADNIPLFADAGKRAANTAIVLRIVKLDPPGKGFKGELPITSSEETIAATFGNGFYRVELCNESKKVLRNKELQISIPEAENSGSNNTGVPGANDQHIAALIRASHSTNKENTQQLMSILEGKANDAKELAKAHTELVTRTTESAAQREREFMKGANEQQQTFFGNMLLFITTQHNQTMQSMQQNHQQQMEQMRAFAERDREQNNPALLMSVLMKGLEMGQGMNDEREPWERSIQAGVDGLDKLLQLKQGSPHTLPPQPRAIAANAGESRPNRQNPERGEPGKRKVPLNQDELIEVIRLKKTLGERGIDFHEMLSQANIHYRDIPDDELFGDATESDTQEGEASSDSEKQTTGDDASADVAD